MSTDFSPPLDRADYHQPLVDTADAARQRDASALLFGTKLFLASLSMLFGAGAVGYLITKIQATVWVPVAPHTLWFSTAVILASSYTLHAGLKKLRESGDAAALARHLIATLILGVAFLLLQIVNWVEIAITAGPTLRQGLYGFMFFTLTVLHALHVVGGLIPLTIATVNAKRGAYTQQHHAGATAVSYYWHFLDVVWCLIFIILYVVR